jgi:hypothetical protein
MIVSQNSEGLNGGTHLCKNVEDVKDRNRSLENQVSKREEDSGKRINI